MVRGDLLKSEVSEAHVRKISRAYRLGMSVYVLSTLIAFANGHLGLAINLSLWILWAVLGYKPREAS